MSFLLVKQAMENMKKYGKTLMSQEPEKTTDLLKLLCTDYKPKDGENLDMLTSSYYVVTWYSVGVSLSSIGCCSFTKTLKLKIP